MLQKIIIIKEKLRIQKELTTQKTEQYSQISSFFWFERVYKLNFLNRNNILP